MMELSLCRRLISSRTIAFRLKIPPRALALAPTPKYPYSHSYLHLHSTLSNDQVSALALRSISSGFKQHPNETRRNSSLTSKRSSKSRIRDDVAFTDPRRHRRASSNNEENRPYSKQASYPFRAPFSAFVSCLPGLEPYLLQEIQYLQSQLERSRSKVEDGKSISHKLKPQQVAGGVKLVVPSLVHLNILQLFLGTASHIYLRLNGSDSNKIYDKSTIQIPPLFTARGFPELQRKLKDMMIAQSWKDGLFHIPNTKNSVVVDESKLKWRLLVHVSASKSKLMHTKAIEERVRRTIGEVLNVEGLDGQRSDDNKSDTVEQEGSRDEGEGDSRPVIKLLVRIEKDLVQVSLDASSSSRPLYKRGYRLNPFTAPLREDLAFALLMSGGLKLNWDLRSILRQYTQKRNHSVDNHCLITGDGDILDETNGLGTSTAALSSMRHLFDPMCGAGTIAIEGAGILAGLPPGRLLPPPLFGTKLYDRNLWRKMKKKSFLALASDESSSNSAKRTKPHENDNTGKILVSANDINKHAIEAATSNAKLAGVDQLIDFKVGHFNRHSLFKVEKYESPATLAVVTNPPFIEKRLAARSNESSQPQVQYKALAKSIKTIAKASGQQIQYAILSNSSRKLRETSLPLAVAFSTKHGGLDVIAMTGCLKKTATDQ